MRDYAIITIPLRSLNASAAAREERHKLRFYKPVRFINADSHAGARVSTNLYGK